MNTFVENGFLLHIGTVLNEKYRIEKHLGSGGFGNTYVATHLGLEQNVAIKEFFIRGINHRETDGITVRVSNDANMDVFTTQKRKFKKEAQRLFALSNQHIVRVFDLFEANNTVYYVMDYIEGESISNLMKRNGKPLTEPQVVSVIYQMIDALANIHANSILHMDIKPGNILVDEKGICTLIDFGSSKQVERHDTVTSQALSYTPGYAPTEQINGTMHRWGEWTDFYALGATIYNMLTARRPPFADDLMNDGRTSFNFQYYQISQSLRELIVWMMQPSISLRPQNIVALRNYLRNSLSIIPEPILMLEDADANANASNTIYNFKNSRTINEDCGNQNNGEDIKNDEESTENVEGKNDEMVYEDEITVNNKYYEAEIRQDESESKSDETEIAPEDNKEESEYGGDGFERENVQHGLRMNETESEHGGEVKGQGNNGGNEMDEDRNQKEGNIVKSPKNKKSSKFKLSLLFFFATCLVGGLILVLQPKKNSDDSNNSLANDSIGVINNKTNVQDSVSTDTINKTKNNITVNISNTGEDDKPDVSNTKTRTPSSHRNDRFADSGGRVIQTVSQNYNNVSEHDAQINTLSNTSRESKPPATQVTSQRQTVENNNNSQTVRPQSRRTNGNALLNSTGRQQGGGGNIQHGVDMKPGSRSKPHNEDPASSVSPNE